MSPKITIEDLLTTLTENLSDKDLMKAELKSNLAVAITDKRIADGLNQKELAEKINKSQATISKWENGDTNFTIDLLVEIAFDLDMDLTISLKPHQAVSKSTRYTKQYRRSGAKTVIFPQNKGNWLTAEEYEDDLEEL